MKVEQDQSNLKMILDKYNSPTVNMWELRLDSEAMESILNRDDVVFMIVGYNMFKYLKRRSKVFRPSKNLNDFLQFKCGTYHGNVVFTCYSISPNDMLLACEDGVERIIFSGFM